MTYKLNEFTATSLLETRDRWQSIAGEDEFSLEHGHLFEWAETHIDYAPEASDSVAYGMFSEDTGRAEAIVEVIQNRKGIYGTTKMLKLLIGPKYWNAGSHLDEISQITLKALIGTIELSRQNHSRTVKIYGRNDHMLSILHSVHIKLQDGIAAGNLKDIGVSIKDRWLIIEVMARRD